MNSRHINECIIFIFFFFFSIFLGKDSSIIGNIGIIFSSTVFLYYFAHKPVFAFMFAFSIHLNLGNYLPDSGFGFPKFFNYKYYFLILSFLVVFSPKLKKILVRDDLAFKKLIFLSLFMSLYQIIICIYIHLSPSYIKTIILIIRNFPQIFGIYLILPVYMLAKYNYKEIIHIIIFMCLALEIAFYITIISPIDLIPIVDYESRYGMSGPMRVYFQGQHYIKLVIGFAVAALFINRMELRLKILILLSAIMLLGNILLSLTRSSIAIISIQIIMFTYVFGILNKYKFTSFAKKFIILIIPAVIFLIISPTIIKNIIETFIVTFINNDFSALSRFTFELPRHLDIIANNFFFGTGFKPFWNNYEFGQTDLPFTANLGKYGLVGIIIFSFFYIYPFIHFKKIFEMIKVHYFFIIRLRELNYIILFLVLSITMLTKPIFNPLYFSFELMQETGMSSFGFYLGVIYGTSRVMVADLLRNNRI